MCWTKYGSYPLHRPYCHEGAVRILLACLEAHANRHKRYIKPLLAVHMDFYVRVRRKAGVTWLGGLDGAGSNIGYLQLVSSCQGSL